MVNCDQLKQQIDLLESKGSLTEKERKLLEELNRDYEELCKDNRNGDESDFETSDDENTDANFLIVSQDSFNLPENDNKEDSGFLEKIFNFFDDLFSFGDVEDKKDQSANIVDDIDSDYDGGGWDFGGSDDSGGDSGD